MLAKGEPAELQASGTAGSAMVKTFSWYSPLEKTKRRIETFEGEIKAARRSEQVGCSGLQNKQNSLQAHIRARASQADS